MNQHLEDFVGYMAERGLSPHTIEAYRRDVTLFLSMTSLQKVNDESVKSFLSYLRSKCYETSSLVRTLIGVKTFFRFLVKEGVLDKNPFHLLETPILWKKLPEVLSIDEIQKLLEVPNSDEIIGARDRAILEILYSSGLRVSEACGLNIQDVKDDFLKVLGKGNKERVVPIGQKALKALDHYLSFRSDSEKALFLTNRGKRIDRGTIWSLIKKYGKKAEIQKPISPHTLRHSFATHLLEGGADIRIIQELLGHCNIATTDRYTQLNQSHLKEAFSKFHNRN